VGGTSSVVVMPVVEKMTLAGRTRTILNLESALTDVLVVVVTISLAITMGSKAQAVDPQGFAQGIVQQFAVGVALGLAGGLLWVRYLRLFTQRSYEYMLTIALLFVFYAITEFLNGSGAIAVLAFGLVVGNSKKRDPLTGADLAKARRRHGALHRWVPVFNIDLVNLHNEIVFFVRAFFFVALGVILDLSIFTNTKFLLIGLALVIGLSAARLWATIIVFWKADIPTPDKKAVAFLMPRGLAAAALASVPFTQYGVTDSKATVGDFVAFAVIVLLLTNLVTSAGVYLFENPSARERLGRIGGLFRGRGKDARS
jgi:cell volume regulation protein A